MGEDVRERTRLLVRHPIRDAYQAIELWVSLSHLSYLSGLRMRVAGTTHIRVKNDMIPRHPIHMRPRIAKREPRHRKFAHTRSQTRRSKSGGSESESEGPKATVSPDISEQGVMFGERLAD